MSIVSTISVFTIVILGDSELMEGGNYSLHTEVVLCQWLHCLWIRAPVV